MSQISVCATRHIETVIDALVCVCCLGLTKIFFVSHQRPHDVIDTQKIVKTALVSILRNRFIIFMIPVVTIIKVTVYEAQNNVKQKYVFFGLKYRIEMLYISVMICLLLALQGPTREMWSVVALRSEYSFITAGMDHMVCSWHLISHKTDWCTRLEVILARV